MGSQLVSDFGKMADAIDIPDLIEIQRVSYDRFLQPDVLPTKRKKIGLEDLLREIFPIESYDKTMNLEYFGYELVKKKGRVKK